MLLMALEWNSAVAVRACRRVDAAATAVRAELDRRVMADRAILTGSMIARERTMNELMQHTSNERVEWDRIRSG